MANSIELQKVLIDFEAGLDAQFPLKELVNLDVSDKFGDDQGDTVYVKARNYGVTYQTSDLTNKMSDFKSEGVPVKLLPYKKGVSFSQLEETVEMGGDESAMIRDWSGEMATTLGLKAYKTTLLGASTAVVSTGTFAQLGLAINNVKKSLAKGKVGGMLSFDATTLITADGTAKFGNSALASKMYQGVIGNYRGADFIEGASEIIETGAIFPAGTFTITNSTNKPGATTCKYTPTSNIASAITVKAGTIITLAGITAVDELGKTTGSKRVFTVQSDVELSGSTAIAVDVGDIYFDGPLKNVSGAISAVALTNLLEASSQYATGVVFNSNAVVIGFKGIKPLRSNSNTMANSEGLPIRVTYEGSAKLSTEDMIFDVNAGFTVYNPRAISGIWIKVS